MARKDRFLVVLYLYLFSILAEIGGLYYFLKAPSAFSKGLAAAAALFMLLCFAAVVTLIILNISCAVRYFREKDGILLRQAMKGMKLGSLRGSIDLYHYGGKLLLRNRTGTFTAPEWFPFPKADVSSHCFAADFCFGCDRHSGITEVFRKKPLTFRDGTCTISSCRVLRHDIFA